jgi:hypothetical protein
MEILAWFYNGRKYFSHTYTTFAYNWTFYVSRTSRKMKKRPKIFSKAIPKAKAPFIEIL